MWENNLISGKISADEFLTTSTAEGLRVTLISCKQLADYMIEKYDFHYLLSGKINQDALEVYKYIKNF